jgi:hypothetical protein
MVEHVPYPRSIQLMVDGTRVHISNHVAAVLVSFNDGGDRRGSNYDDNRSVNYMVRQGWCIHTRGVLRLTAAGLRVRAVLLEYRQRKKEALAR